MRNSVFFLMCALFLASCGSKKQMMGSGTENISGIGKEASVAEFVQMVNAKRVTEPSISAKVNLSLSAGSKSTRVPGTLRMKRNDVIQLSLVALGVMEVGRLELTPDYMMVVDRINHQFVKCAYSDVDFFKNAGIDFYTFQSLFWNELFVLNSKGEVPSANSYSLKTDNNVISLVNAKDRNVALTFIVNVANQLVSETRFSKTETDVPVIRWTYGEWSKLSESDFPGSMKISFEIPKEMVEATLRIGNAKSDSNWETRTEINRNRYSEVSLQAAFSRIMSLAE